jgi:hypothetical protein
MDGASTPRGAALVGNRRPEAGLSVASTRVQEGAVATSGAGSVVDERAATGTPGGRGRIAGVALLAAPSALSAAAPLAAADGPAATALVGATRGVASVEPPVAVKSFEAGEKRVSKGESAGALAAANGSARVRVATVGETSEAAVATAAAGASAGMTFADDSGTTEKSAPICETTAGEGAAPAALVARDGSTVVRVFLAGVAAATATLATAERSATLHATTAGAADRAFEACGKPAPAAVIRARRDAAGLPAASGGVATLGAAAAGVARATAP